MPDCATITACPWPAACLWECLTHEGVAQPLDGCQALILQHNVLCCLLGAAVRACPEHLPACEGRVQDHAPDLLEREVRQLKVALRPRLLSHLHAGQQRPDLAQEIDAPLPRHLHMQSVLRINPHNGRQSVAGDSGSSCGLLMALCMSKSCVYNTVAAAWPS